MRRGCFGCRRGGGRGHDHYRNDQRSGIKNGKLLERAVGEFDVLLTVDKEFATVGDHVPHAIGLVILRAGSTDFDALRPHMAAVNLAIGRVKPNEVVRVGR